MPDHFQGSAHVELQPGDENLPVRFRFNAATASTSNDGAMPFGSTVNSVISSVKDERGIDATTSIIATSQITQNVVTIYLNHSSDVADGKYTLTSKVTFSLAGTTILFTREFDFRRVYLRNE
jgi:hypothetical protein